jgi:hypothetical protein
MYKPNQRRVKVDVLATAGWVTGTMHVPVKTCLAAALNRKGQFIALTDVMTDPCAPRLAFLALRRDAIMLVIPDAEGLDRVATVQPGSHHDALVRCFFASAVAEGHTQVLDGLRVSDFLETNPGFITLTGCDVTTQDGDRRPGTSHVIVNTSHVLAVTEITCGEETEELTGATLALSAR